MTPAKAYEIASQWGSAMHAGDPGSVFYSFPVADGRPQNEDHRKMLLNYTDDCLKIAGPANGHTAEDVAELNALRKFFAEWPLSLDEFTAAYIQTALWSSNDESTDSGGEPLDANYSVDDFSPDLMAEVIADCAKFQAEHGATMAKAIETGKVKFGPDFGPMGRAGHDFWLTRCGHGAGFWDGDWPEPYATQLTDACKAFGNVDLYVGDDKKIYAM